MSHSAEISIRRVRAFLPPDFKITSWELLKPYFADLERAELTDATSVHNWLLKLSELQFVIYEEKAWRYIRMTRNTADEAAGNEYQRFYNEIITPGMVALNELQVKAGSSPHFHALDPVTFQILKRTIENHLNLYREENVPVLTAIQNKSREFDVIASGMSIDIDGQKITIQKATTYLESHDPTRRRDVWRRIMATRLRYSSQLNALFTELIRMRHQVATNAGFGNFTDYAYRSMGRFDYGRIDCAQFREAIAKVVRPVYEATIEDRRKRLGQGVVRPWDLFVDIFSDKPLTPFTTGDQLISGVIKILNRLDPSIGEKIEIMRKMDLLDVESRLNKAPGGYNYPLPETGAPFIFMNAVGSWSDVTTMIHEAGHALHSFAINTIALFEHRSIPSEVAELASMSMEYITMDFLDEFYSSDDELRRARKEQINRMIMLLPWIASIDEFQHWAYDHPEHTITERARTWSQIYSRYHGEAIDWSGHEESLSLFWQKQGHLYDVPFYYIEYGFAQLGAVAIWRNYKRNPEEALQKYLHALSLGYSRPIPEIYAAAGIRFDFSEEYISELIGFLQDEIAAL